MLCKFFASDVCRSCSNIQQPYADQLVRKQNQVESLLSSHRQLRWLEPQASEALHFRNKAKMVVMGTSDEPILGISNHAGQQIDLAACPLYPNPFQQAFGFITAFIRQVKLQPYDVQKQRGELKFILLSRSQATGQWMLRFVLRSKNQLAAIVKHLPSLQQQWPELAVCSVNLQPEHKAVLEGEEEIILTQQQMLFEQMNDVPLYLQPQSFFQTNPALAEKLYQAARDWVADLNVPEVWDLFCGTGGFALHLATAERRVCGIEISASAIACASRSANEMMHVTLDFQALDASTFAKAQQQSPDLLVVNPPRRGLGPMLCQTINTLQPDWLLYSSCNPQTLAADLRLLPIYQLQKAQLFDFFPHTEHAEVLCLLKRQPQA